MAPISTSIVSWTNIPTIYNWFVSISVGGNTALSIKAYMSLQNIWTFFEERCFSVYEEKHDNKAIPSNLRTSKSTYSSQYEAFGKWIVRTICKPDCESLEAGGIRIEHRSYAV